MRAIKIGLLTLLALTTSVSTVAHPGGHAHEFETSTRGAIFHTSGYDNLYSATLGYSRNLMEPLQGSLNFQFSHEGPLSGVLLLAGPTLNVTSEDKDQLDGAFFVGARAGLSYSRTKKGSSSHLAYVFLAGKRFELRDGICWKPELSLSGTSATGDTATWTLRPIQFSIFF